MNPCKCGNYGNGTKRCICSQQELRKYRAKLSGPLLDRLDLIVDVQPVSFSEMAEGKGKETSAEIRCRVEEARKLAAKRLSTYGIHCNAQMPHALVKKLCVLNEDAGHLLKQAFQSLQLSARSYDKILKVARTIADLQSHEQLEAGDVAEAIYLRSAFRKYWPD
jgi:magnesium chelatase family protein